MAPAGMRAALVALTIAGMLAVWRLFATVFTGMFVAVMFVRLFALGTLGPVGLRLVALDLVAITLLISLLVSVRFLIRPVGREDIGGRCAGPGPVAIAPAELAFATALRSLQLALERLAG
jgi:hypothetical protein